VNRQVKRGTREEKERNERRSKKKECRGSGMGGRRWERESLSRLTPKQEEGGRGRRGGSERGR